VAWEAFEKTVAEIFASKGFTVDIVAKRRGSSADIIAVRRDPFGAEIRYLVECKRRSGQRTIGLGVVNAVLGAKVRAKADYAFLVTTSNFSTDVNAQRPRLRDLRLHLADGAEVIAWLQEYVPRNDEGLWLEDQWNRDTAS
jgi:HJR/Mrr/RecB family endonuclease